MRRRDVLLQIAAFIVIFGAIVAASLMSVYRHWLPNATVYFDFLTSGIIFASFIVAYVVYAYGRKAQALTLSEGKRDDFMKGKNAQHVRMLIENNDMELQTAVIILNIVKSTCQYDEETLPREYQELIEELDQYLNFFEGVGILYNHGDISRESTEGLWTYYSKRLMEASTLDTETNHIKKERIRECMRKIYAAYAGGHIPKRVDDAWNKACESPVKIPDPIGRYEAHKGLISWCLARVRTWWQQRVHPSSSPRQCPQEERRINPLEKPIWYYINCGEYCYEHTIKMACKLKIENSKRNKKREEEKQKKEKSMK